MSEIGRWARGTCVHGALAAYRGRRNTSRALRKSGLDAYFDTGLKRRVMSGDLLSLEEMRDKYERAWEGIVDDCVTGNDLENILAHLEPSSKTCLEVGCGAGRVAIEIAKTGREVTGSDISLIALRYAKERAEEAGVSIGLAEAAVEKLPFPDRAFDAVICAHTLEHVQDLGIAVAELTRVAARQLIVIVPREDRVSEFGTDYHLQCFPTPDALSAAIPLEQFECFVECVENPQWHGEYVFYSGRAPEPKAERARRR
jgi:ubiquinone/menaquinone biosynthesis C-methylase UbiE